MAVYPVEIVPIVASVPNVPVCVPVRTGEADVGDGAGKLKQAGCAVVPFDWTAIR